MICYAIARLTSALLLYGSSSSPAVQSIFVDLALVMLPTALFGWTRPSLEQLSDRIPARSLLNTKEILSLAVQLALIIFGQGMALIMAQHQPWFQSSQQVLLDCLEIIIIFHQIQSSSFVFYSTVTRCGLDQYGRELRRVQPVAVSVPDGLSRLFGRPATPTQNVDQPGLHPEPPGPCHVLLRFDPAAAAPASIRHEPQASARL